MKFTHSQPLFCVIVTGFFLFNTKLDGELPLSLLLAQQSPGSVPIDIFAPVPPQVDPPLIPDVGLQDFHLDETATPDDIRQTIATYFTRWNNIEKDLVRYKLPSALLLFTDVGADKALQALDNVFFNVPDTVFIPTMYDILLHQTFQRPYQIQIPFHSSAQTINGDNIQSYFLAKLLAGHLTGEMIPEIVFFARENTDTACVVAWNDDIIDSPKATETLISLIKMPASPMYSKTSKLMVILRVLRSDQPAMQNALPDIFANLGPDAYAAETSLRPLLLNLKEYRTSQTLLQCLTTFLTHVTNPGTRSNINFDLALMGDLPAMNQLRLNALNVDNPSRPEILQRVREMCQAYKIAYKGDPGILRQLQWDAATAKWVLPP